MLAAEHLSMVNDEVVIALTVDHVQEGKLFHAATLRQHVHDKYLKRNT